MQTELGSGKTCRTSTPALLHYCTGILGSEHGARTPCSKPLSRPGGAAAPSARVKITSRLAVPSAYRTALDMPGGKPPPTTPPAAVGAGPRHQRRTARRPSAVPLDRALMLGRCWTAWTTPRWRTSTGCPRPYLRTRYSRAKAKLAAILKEGEHEP